MRIIAEKNKAIENTEKAYWEDMYLCPDDQIKENYLWKWDKIFENYVSDKELIPNIYKELTKLNSKTILIIQFKIG